MAERKDSKENSVRIVGCIKENNLELVVNNRGDRVVRGNLIIVTDEKGLDSHKVQFYCSETNKRGEHSKDFDALCEILPSKVVSVASYLEDNPGSNFEEAMAAASKVWIIARLEEYARRTGERVDSMTTIKGFRAGLRKPTDKNAYTPASEFSIDVYIDDIKPEMDAEENETGRLMLNCVFVNYNGHASRFDFVAPTEDGIADYIKKHYKPGQTVNLKGDIVDLAIREAEESPADDFFGRGNTHVQYKTTFIHERKILGGSKTPLDEGNDRAYSKKTITDALAAREIAMDENGKRAASHSANTYTAVEPDPEPVKTTATVVDADGLDF